MGDFGLHKVLHETAKNPRKKQKRRTLADAEREERAKCCKDVCLFCEKDFSVKRMKHGLWVHGDVEGEAEYCLASAIRERAAEESK